MRATRVGNRQVDLAYALKGACEYLMMSDLRNCTRAKIGPSKRSFDQPESCVA
jgi:hypothetical protein